MRIKPIETDGFSHCLLLRRSVRSSSASTQRCGDTESDKSQCDHQLHDGISVSWRTSSQDVLLSPRRHVGLFHSSMWWYVLAASVNNTRACSLAEPLRVLSATAELRVYPLYIYSIRCHYNNALVVPGCKKVSTISLAILAQYLIVTDRQTDSRTDRNAITISCCAWFQITTCGKSLRWFLVLLQSYIVRCYPFCCTVRWARIRPFTTR